MPPRRCTSPADLSDATAWTFAPDTESTDNWKARLRTLPISLMVARRVMVGRQPSSFGGGRHPGWQGDPFIGTLLRLEPWQAGSRSAVGVRRAGWVVRKLPAASDS